MSFEEATDQVVPQILLLCTALDSTRAPVYTEIPQAITIPSDSWDQLGVIGEPRDVVDGLRDPAKAGVLLESINGFSDLDSPHSLLDDLHSSMGVLAVFQHL